jgi:hypothetical protein
MATVTALEVTGERVRVAVVALGPAPSLTVREVSESETAGRSLSSTETLTEAGANPAAAAVTV